jgi:tape measure domain-containing protein
VGGGNNEVVIDVVAKLRDKMSPDIKQTERNVSKLDETVKRAQKNTEKFGSMRARPSIDVNDKATQKIHQAISSGQSFARRAFSATLSATDKATKTVDLIRGSCKSFGSSVFTTTLKVADKVTEPVRSITDKLLSVKTLIAGMATGAAAKAFIGAPITLADNLSTASIGFETMLGSASKAQQMMGSIQKFAIETPFGTQDLVKDSQQMLAYGFNAKQIIPTLNAIGNAEAALGGGSEGIQRVIVALGQMKMKGKMSSAEMLQMTDNSINAWKYVAQSMGKTVPQIQAMAEKGLIPADKAVNAIVKGMGEFNGMMDKTANRTASGLISQIQDTFDIGIITKWGRGLQNGAINGLTRFNKFLGDIDPILKKAGSSLEDFGSALSTKVFNVLGHIEDRMTKVFSSDRFKKADIGGKIHIAWDEVIAQPFSSWWESTGKKKIAKKLSGIGQSFGSGITGGITTILGFNDGDAKQQGINLGSSFISGFLKGFDMKKIGNAFQGFAERHKALMVTLGLKLGANLMSGVATGIRNSRTLLDSVKGIFGKKSSGGGPGMNMPSASTVSSMNVLANVVNIAGKAFGGASSVPVSVPRTSGLPALPSGGNKPLLEAGKAAAGGSLLQRFGASKAGSLFGKIGTKLGTGAATAGGAALAGSATTAGALTAGVAAIGAGKDFYDASKLSAGKARKDKLFQGGTKLGMIGAGAGAGAATGAGIGAIFGGVGAAPGALIGAGIGGVGALLGGNAAGKALSDSTDKGGALNNIGKSVGGFFTKTVPDTAGKVGNGIGTFISTKVAPTVSSAGKAIGDVFTNKIPGAFQTMGNGLGTFFTQMVPQAIQAAGTSIGGFFTDMLPTFLSQQLPFAIGYVGGQIVGFFANILPQAFNTLMTNIGGFFTNQVGPALSAVGGAVGGFFTSTLPSFFGMVWNGVTGFFTQTLPTVLTTVGGTIGTFFTSTIPSFFEMVWNGATGFFTQTLPTVLATIGGALGMFFTSTVPSFFGMVWSGVYGFFAQTLPSALAIVGAATRTFFTSTVPNFFSGLFNSIGGFFTQTIPQAAKAAGSTIQTFFTQTIPNAVSTAFSSMADKVKNWATSAISNAKDWFSNIGKGYQKGYASTQSAHKASGGLVSRPTTTLLGEEGTPEMVIPLSGRRHDRGVQLWQQAGSVLGQNIDAKANGGFGGQVIQFPSNVVGDTPSPQPQRVSAGSVVGMNGGTKVVIQEIKIVVKGGNDGDVVQQIKDNKEEIANIVSDAIADGFERNQNNTPLEECS